VEAVGAAQGDAALSAAPGVSATVVARVLNLSVSRVHELAKQPGFPAKQGPGLFDLNKVTLWYIRYLQAELRRRGPSGGVETAGILAERLRLLKTQTEKGERDNAFERGEFLRASSVESVWVKVMMNCRSRLLAMPSKLALTLVNQAEPGLIAEVIRREVYLALAELSSGAVDVADEAADEAADVETDEIL
jgi:phage terminase Nu1 subunit (DNA packaging protein)